MVMAKNVGYQELEPPLFPLSLGHIGQFLHPDSTPETLMPEGNKSRVSGDGVESNRPATNSPRIPVDSNRFDCLVEVSGLSVDSGR